MTVSEVFSAVSAHMIKGMMFHDQMSRYYGFLGFCGFEKCHAYHYACESKAYQKLNRFFTEHFGMLVPESEVEDPGAIPESWYTLSRNQVDPQKRIDAVKSGLASWIAWETMTKEVYQSMEKELFNMGETDAAHYFADLVHDVSCELKGAEKRQALLSATMYDPIFIVEMQDELYSEYKGAMKHA